MKIIYVLLLTFCFISRVMCLNLENKYIPARYVVLAEEINCKMAKKYAEQYAMTIVCDRAGLMHKVNLLGFDFQIRGPLSQEQLRKILIDCVEDLLNELNINEEIRPFLKTYPFTSKEVNIGIFIVDANGGKNVFYPSIGVARATKEKIVYRKYDPNSQYSQDKEVLEEFYTDALKIVQA